MPNSKQTLIPPFLLIALGTGWLLTTLGVVPAIDWIWTLGLAITGVLFFVMGGFNKFTFVGGSFFVCTSLFSAMRQTGQLALNTEVPILVILSGVLMLIAHSSAIPNAPWMLDAVQIQQPSKKGAGLS